MTPLKRMFDITAGSMLLLVLGIPMIAIAVAIALTSPGSILYISDRVGANNVLFKMIKFRTMRMNTPAVATHLLGNVEHHVTPIGKLLRKTSLDELPQLWNIIRGDMSFVGPRPALYNQYDLIALRTEKGVHELVPGLTGWAQIHGRDSVDIPEKVTFDEYYLLHHSWMLDMIIIAKTLRQALTGEGVSH